MAQSPLSDPAPGPSAPEEAPVESLHLPINVVEHIFSALGPRDIALAAAVTSSWHTASFSAPWAEFYASTWPVTPRAVATASASSWAAIYAARMGLARGFCGRPQLDHLAPGLTSGVRCAKILSGIFDTDLDLALTGSVDRTLALWDLGSGTRLASSALHAGTVRCVAADSDVMLTGSSDHRIRVWRRADNAENAADDGAGRGPEGFPFQVDGQRAVLPGGHSGPVSALELAPTALFSGSWDYCVRVWSRGGANANADAAEWPDLECIQSLHFDDWVNALALIGGGKNSNEGGGVKLLVAAGREVHVIDPGAGGGAVPLFSLNRNTLNNNGGGVTAVAGTHDGRMAFYGTSEGGIHAADLRVNPNSGSSGHVLELAAASAVTGLAWDYPWLAASLQNGEVLLLDAEAAVSGGGGRSGGGVLNSASQRSSSGSARAPFNYRGSGGGGSSGWRRQPDWPCRAVAAGVPGGAQCVALSGRWLAAGFEGGAVATWDFGRAGEARREAEALRAGRRRERERRQAAAAAERKGRGKKKSGSGKTTDAAAEGDAWEDTGRPPLPQSAPLPIPRPSVGNNAPPGSSSYQSGRSMGASPVGTSAGGRGAAAARVPAPISLGRSPGATGGEEGQSRWAVLRMSRSASAGSVGQRAQQQQQQQQRPEPAAAAIEDDSRDDAWSSDSDV